MECPHCKNPFIVPYVAHTNAENYGSQSFNIRCSKCKKIARVYIVRKTTVEYIAKTTDKYTSWGE